MADPQLEEGYTRIANDILEAISLLRISGEESQVFWTIVRKTYGYQKTWDKISLSQFCLATGMNKQNVCRALSKLIKKKMVIKTDKGKISSYRIQKDYTHWLPLSKMITLSKPIKPIIKTDKENVINIETHKRNKNTKETITKEKKSIVPTMQNQRSGTKKVSPIDQALTQLLITLMEENYPDSTILRKLHSENRQEDWINTCRLLREVDKRTPDEIKRVIEFSQNNDFWKNNILSMTKVRKNWDMLWIKSKPKKTAKEGLEDWAMNKHKENIYDE